MTPECKYGPAAARPPCPVVPIYTRKQGNKILLCFPEFCYAWPQWIGASYITIEFKLETQYKWIAFSTLRRYVHPDYVLAVRTGGKRYKFWENIGEEFFAPVYNGEPIYQDAVFEVWNTREPWVNFFPEFCITITKFDECICEDTPQLKARKELWAKFCKAPYAIVDPAVKSEVQFFFEKPCTTAPV